MGRVLSLFSGSSLFFLFNFFVFIANNSLLHSNEGNPITDLSYVKKTTINGNTVESRIIGEMILSPENGCIYEGEDKLVGLLVIRGCNSLNLRNLKTLIGALLIHDSKVSNLGQLREIVSPYIAGYEGYFFENNSGYVIGHLFINNSEVISLSPLEKVERLDLRDVNSLSTLDPLKTVDFVKIGHLQSTTCTMGQQASGSCPQIESTIFNVPDLSSLGSLENVRELEIIGETKLNDLGRIKKLESFRLFPESKPSPPLKNLGNILSISKELSITSDKIETLTPLETIGSKEENHASVYIVGKSLTTLGNLREVFGSIMLINTQIKTLGKLEMVENNLKISNHKQYPSKLEDTGNLKIVEEFESNSKVLSSFPNLREFNRMIISPHENLSLEGLRFTPRELKFDCDSEFLMVSYSPQQDRPSVDSFLGEVLSLNQNCLALVQ